ncbi:uncharacterized protein LOC126834876 [Adelges cooleyi]|uniref:uncharacterized protein LOC126834876 n=1 Tax=Adelges cooleyi TaxID=133065 RepID=UPI00218073DD|nr:uncharacterized protein LOC126834876 [Adelges cooleyi]
MNSKQSNRQNNIPHPYTRNLILTNDKTNKSPTNSSAIRISEITTTSNVTTFNNPNGVSDMKLLIGNVEQISHWSRRLSFLPATDIIYQVYGILSSIKTGKTECEKMICLRGQQAGCAIVCVFYEIDRKLQAIAQGKLVLCTGKAIGINKFQIFTVKELRPYDKVAFHRATVVSQWSVDELLKSKNP